MSHPRIEEVSDSDDAISDPEEADIDDFDDTDILRRRETGTAAPTSSAAAASLSRPSAAGTVPVPAPAHTQQPTTLPRTTDRSQYATFQCLYPVYFDASRSRSEGRRVPSSLAVRDPLAREIANACSRLRLPTLLEPDKTHPKDWANPGRVKVGLKQSKSAATTTTTTTSTTAVNNKHHLYILIAKHLRDNPTNDDSLGLRVRMGGELQPEQGKPYPRPAVPRGWKMGELLPYMSAAMTGGGVSENLFKDMMREMQSGGDPMSALMGGGGGSGPGSGAEEGGGGSGSGRKKKDKKKGKA
ncbi:Signal recognition particle SEC65 subunit-like protein [Hapsidospora chrysogenum ATCC 11550]|uniref:Signal recognition particle SEC65 subunit-like protein n=1 Tax=Hapsidospora chrysogenum (strain ATCC 11550 / CBS 779.69 / DSM 880 / IAM 14645 / JCM 23072 / IMI 49137) TaxID=857340 RepID=A0A086T617_HAPC1|nr:Signal recognition particle SEC65 subunit-like protein [Hapsidospora chrysogenum ATCC 11550]